MPKGFAGVREASAEIEARRGSGGPGAGVLWFRLKSGEEQEVRFLEQDDDIHWAMMHEVPVEGRQWGADVPCLDQDKEGIDCPGCERDLPRRFKGYINLINFNAPVFKRDDSNKIVKDRLGDPVIVDHKAQVCVWSSGIRVFEELDEIDTRYKGLTSRRFVVKRKGEGLSTKYSINPADPDSGPQDFTDAENKLAAEKFELVEFVKPPSYEDFVKKMEGKPTGSGGGGSSTPQESANPFMRKRPS